MPASMLYVHACLLISVVSESVTLGTIAHHIPLSMNFSRQEYWSPLGNLPDPEIKPAFLASPVW